MDRHSDDIPEQDGSYLRVLLATGLTDVRRPVLPPVNGQRPLPMAPWLDGSEPQAFTNHGRQVHTAAQLDTARRWQHIAQGILGVLVLTAVLWIVLAP